ncbi:hypothetical protein SAMN05444064_102189 [Pseudomonas syringae]|nr:hypothetical protein SAMN05444514_102220 [Pseudomonas syringae]SFL53294.1 hypothetical protein SAMN05444064_102189 [Pseudomonas syringae]
MYHPRPGYAGLLCFWLTETQTALASGANAQHYVHIYQ